MTKANDNFPPHDPDEDRKNAAGCLGFGLALLIVCAGLAAITAWLALHG